MRWAHGKLFPAGFALVPPDRPSYDTQVTFFGRFRVSMKYSCDDPIEKTYYNDRLKMKPVCNYVTIAAVICLGYLKS